MVSVYDNKYEYTITRQRPNARHGWAKGTAECQDPNIFDTSYEFAFCEKSEPQPVYRDEYCTGVPKAVYQKSWLLKNGMFADRTSYILNHPDVHLDPSPRR